MLINLPLLVCIAAANPPAGSRTVPPTGGGSSGGNSDSKMGQPELRRKIHKPFWLKDFHLK